jgi:hypothetical protein
MNTPNGSRKTTKVAKEQPAADASEGAKGAETPKTIDEEVSGAVRRGYGVITEALQQGREAAKKFRGGNYGVSAAKEDVAQASGRMVELAGELVETTFRLSGRLLTELATATTREPSPQMDLTVTVDGDATGKAKGSASAIRRPTQGGLKDLSVPLLSSPSGVALAAKVDFEANLATGGFNAVVTLTAEPDPGTYHGHLLAKAEQEPLGSLTIVIPPVVAPAVVAPAVVAPAVVAPAVEPPAIERPE